MSLPCVGLADLPVLGLAAEETPDEEEELELTPGGVTGAAARGELGFLPGGEAVPSPSGASGVLGRVGCWKGDLQVSEILFINF